MLKCKKIAKFTAAVAVVGLFAFGYDVLAETQEERLQKYLANCGVASRRKCEEYILQGKVKVNGVIVTELGTKINPERDDILIK